MRANQFCVAVAVAASLLASCGDDKKEEIRIGLVTAKSGIFATFGVGDAFGSQAAIDDINAEGGIYIKEAGGKLPVRLIVKDDKSSEIEASAAVEELASVDGVHALSTGNQPPSMVAPAARVAETFRIPNVGYTPFEPWAAQRAAASEPWRYAWISGFAIATPAADGDFRAGLAGYTIRDNWFAALDAVASDTNRTVGIFATDEADGRGWYGLFAGLLNDAGYTVIGADGNEGLFPLDSQEVSAIVQTWIDNDVEIVWGNTPAPHGKMVLQTMRDMGFNPKAMFLARGALFYPDVSTWGEVAAGVGAEMFWSDEFPAETCPGIGSTTPRSLGQRWTAATGEPLRPSISGYGNIQVLLGAIERAQSLDADAINAAIGSTDTGTIFCRTVFDANEHMNRTPQFLGQWTATDDGSDLALRIVHSDHEWLAPEASLVFPRP